MNAATVKTLALSLTLAAAALLSQLAAPVQATSIGLNFSYNGNAADANSTDPTIMAPGDTTGVVPQAHWNTVTFRDWYDAGGMIPVTFGTNTAVVSHPGPTGLVDSTGAATTVNVTSNAVAPYFESANAAYAGTTATEKMLYGFTQIGSTVDTLTITGISAPKVDVYAYFAINSTADTEATLGGTSYYFSNPAGDQSTFTQATNTTPGVYTQSGNYVLWSGVTPSSGTVAFSFSSPDSPNAGLAGFEIVLLPEPSSIVLMGCASIACLWAIRRRKTGAKG